MRKFTLPYSMPKESFSTNASTLQIETSNGKDEESAAQIRVSPLPAHIAIQRSGVPACRAAKTVFLQSLPKTCTPEPHPSLLLRRATATSGRHIR